MTEMNLIYFLQELIIKGWNFWLDEGEVNFDAPNNFNVEVLEQLRENKAEILHLLQESPDIFNVYPLSHGQQSLWFLWQLEPSSSAYNLVFAIRIYDNLNLASLRLAFEQLCQRHPSLRSTCPQFKGNPIRQLHSNSLLDFQLIDVSEQNEAELESFLYQESQLPFDLEHESVMRVRLYTRSDTEHILILTMHHFSICMQHDA